MTTYYVFHGYVYYPDCGFGDLKHATTDQAEARAVFAALAVDRYDWAELYEAEPGQHPKLIASREGGS